MSKSKKKYVCSNCGSITNKWGGQCFDCQAWGTIYEELIEENKTTMLKPLHAKSLNIESLGAISTESDIRLITPIHEFNRVIGGGLVPSSVTLVGGEPGIGKSTLLLQIAAALANNGTKCLYCSGEESTTQIKLRADRLQISCNDLYLISATNTSDIIATLDIYKEIVVVIIDSIQTMYAPEIASSPGTVSQVRASSHELINYAKSNGIILFLVGHVTKDGQIAGPKVLEHMVDTVLYFESDEHYLFRILRTIKNRFGGINEIGVFEMQGNGLREVSNPSELFFTARQQNISGISMFAGVEGSRPLLIEIQALLTPSNMAMPRRSVIGWNLNRLSMILAVLLVRYRLNLMNYEVYLTVSGGLKIEEPAADLAIAAALISAATNTPLPLKSIFFGEINLSGEIRKTTYPEIRVNEAKKLGFDEIIGPIYNESQDSQNKNFGIFGIKHIIQLQNTFGTKN